MIIWFDLIGLFNIYYILSTFLNILGTVDRPDTGSVYLKNIKYTEKTYHKLRRDHIGYIFQTLNLIPFLSVSENIALGIKFSSTRQSKVNDLSQEVVRLITSLGLEKEILNTPIDHLSVGQQQRAAVARALLGMPDLILADEPTSALDNDTTTKFLREVMNTFDPSHQAIIMVSHDLSIASYFDTVIDFNKHNA